MTQLKCDVKQFPNIFSHLWAPNPFYPVEEVVIIKFVGNM